MEPRQEHSESIYLNPWISLVVVGSAVGLTVLAAGVETVAAAFPLKVLGLFENLSSNLMTSIGESKVLVTSSFAFVAGMVSTFNPCGFPLLPVYLGLYLSSGTTETASRSMVKKIAKPLYLGGVVAFGLIILFGLAGAILGVASQMVLNSLPWLGLGVGILLVAGGWWTLSGQGFHSWRIAYAATRIGKTNQIGVVAYFLFGVSFGIASLSCTLPIFLTVVGTTLTHSGVVASIGQLFLYGSGMGFVIVVLTVLVALLKTSLTSGLERIVPYINLFTALLMTFIGCYIVFYWLTLGGIF